MLNKLKFNTLSLSFLFLMFVLAWGTTTAFAAETNIYNPSFVMTANGDRVEFDIIDSDPADIDIKCDNSMRGEGKKYIVYLNKVKITFRINGREHWDIFDCGFCMEVLNNKVTTYGNEWINRPRYQNKSLTCSPTRKSVTLFFNFYHGVYPHPFPFHLTAEVTGFNDEVSLRIW